MSNIYRVISLSIVMSLFFAAPLLCVVPISTQIKETEKLAAKNDYAVTAKVVWKRKSYGPQGRFRAAAWARSVHQSKEVTHEPAVREANWTRPAAVAASWEAGGWEDGQHQDWDNADVTGGIGGIGTESPKSIYY